MDLRILPQPLPTTLPTPVPAPTFALLAETRPGTRVQLIALRMEAGRRALLHRMGLIESRHVKVIHNDHKGVVVLTLDEDLFLLGRRETPHIQVRILHDNAR